MAEKYKLLEKIILGRTKSDLEKYGDEGVVFLGRKITRIGVQHFLTNPIYMDVVKPHAILICGKRGGGKCVTPETRIVLFNGKTVPIEKLFNNIRKNLVFKEEKEELYYVLDNTKVISLNSKLFLEPSNIKYFYRKYVNEELIEIKTSKGKRITVTKEHPLLVRTVNGFKWIRAGNVRKGDIIITVLPKHKKIKPSGSKTAVIESINKKYKLYMEEVKKISIEPYNGWVYDLCIEKNHNFIGNYILCHNSYTAGVIAEAMATIDEKVARNIASVMFDTMGIYWTMKYPNYDQADLLEKWGLEPRGLEDKVNTLVPAGLFEEAKEYGIKPDGEIRIEIARVSGEEWLKLMRLSRESNVGAFIERLIEKMRDDYDKFGFEDIYSEIDKANVPQFIKWAAENRFKYFERLGLFFEEGLSTDEFVQAGKINVLDISYYVHLPGGNEVRALVIAVISRKVFEERIKERKKEEVEYIDYIKKKHQYKGYEYEFKKKKFPLVWLIIDEAHEFMPKVGDTLATDILVQILREGRQPGISTILITQQPGKIHTDAITQSDIIISHILTAKIDIDALSEAMQTYVTMSVPEMMITMPKMKGACVVLDDKVERMYQMQVRPRITWHGGAEPRALEK